MAIVAVMPMAKREAVGERDPEQAEVGLREVRRHHGAGTEEHEHEGAEELGDQPTGQ